LSHEGGFFDNMKTGEIVNMGITQKFLDAHNLPCTAEDVRILTRAAAINLYGAFFWVPLRLAELKNQDLAAKVFDLAVNVGPETAVKLFQAAINDEWGHNWVAVDGKIGAVTLGCANNADPVLVLALLREHAENHYRDVAEKNPNVKDDLAGWLARLAS
jgi:lysozyme family protein